MGREGPSTPSSSIGRACRPYPGIHNTLVNTGHVFSNGLYFAACNCEIFPRGDALHSIEKYPLRNACLTLLLRRITCSLLTRACFLHPQSAEFSTNFRYHVIDGRGGVNPFSCQINPPPGLAFWRDQPCSSPVALFPSASHLLYRRRESKSNPKKRRR